MIGIDWAEVAVYLRPGSTDLRKQASGLSLIASEQMHRDPLSGNLFLFCNRDRRLLKAVYWDRNGFCLWQKKLERDRFPWPQDEQAVRQITGTELRMLLNGIDFFHAHQRLSYQTVS